jgi:hypothetical protein
MLFSWGRNRDIEQFATGVARDFAKACPAAETQGERAAVKKLARSIDAACERAAAFQKEKKLGIYGKAKFGTTFKWELKALGYDDDFIDEFTRNMMLRLSR